MKKSLLITLDFPPKKGGTSNTLWQFCENLPREDISVLTELNEIHVKTAYPVSRKRLIFDMRFFWPRWLPLLWHSYKMVRKDKIEMIQAGQILPIGTVALILKILFKIPYIVYVYGQDLLIVRRNKRRVWLISKILKNSDGVIACSNYTSKLAKSLGAPSSRTKVVYPCPSEFTREEVFEYDFEAFLEKNSLHNKKIILSVGNLVQRKGQDMVIKSLPLVLQEIPNAIYLIVGSGPDAKRLNDLIDKVGVRNKVKLFEKISNDELPLFYRVSDVFIMPSRELKNKFGETVDVEGFGLVFLEANLYGKPVIGGNLGGIPEAIENNSSGFLVDPNSEKDIADSLIRILKDQEEAKKIGIYGKQRVMDKFKIEIETSKIRDLIQNE